MGFSDFDVVTEHAIVANFERRDSGAPPFRCFEVGDPVLGVGARAANFVQLGVVASADGAAFFEEKGGSSTIALSISALTSERSKSARAGEPTALSEPRAMLLTSATPVSLIATRSFG
jgi:hypothetical protein